jgi:hypothetical protein
MARIETPIFAATVRCRASSVRSGWLIGIEDPRHPDLGAMHAAVAFRLRVHLWIAIHLKGLRLRIKPWC